MLGALSTSRRDTLLFQVSLQDSHTDASICMLQRLRCKARLLAATRRQGDIESCLTHCCRFPLSPIVGRVAELLAPHDNVVEALPYRPTWLFWLVHSPKLGKSLGLRLRLKCNANAGCPSVAMTSKQEEGRSETTASGQHVGPAATQFGKQSCKASSCRRRPEMVEATCSERSDRHLGTLKEFRQFRHQKQSD